MMSTEAGQGKEGKFVFVGGPLMNKGGPLRSRAIRQGLRETKQRRQTKAAVESEELLSKGINPECTCNREMTGLRHSELPFGSETIQRFRPIKPKAPESRIRLRQSYLCSFCGRYTAMCAQRPPGVGSVFDIVSGNRDPLLPNDPSTARLNMHELLHLAGTEIWPNFRPLGYTTDCYQSWVVPYNDKLNFYAVLWSASYHLDVLRLTYGSPGYEAGSQQQFFLKGLALKTLREAIETYTGVTPIDNIIMCILYLAVNDTAMTRVYRDPSPFRPRFVGLHALDFYGSRDYHSLHWSVIQNLLGDFGGIHALRTFAVAWLLSISDIMNAVHTLRKPIYPCLGLDGTVLSLDTPLLLFAPYGVKVKVGSQKPGIGFHNLLSLEPPVQRGLVTALANVGELAYVLQCLSEQSCSPKALDLLGDCRNLVHHRLFSLANEKDPTEKILQYQGESAAATEQSKELYLTSRLAAILFAIHVTFPIPRSSIVSAPLLDYLCPKLESLVDQGISNKIMLWCASVALIALDGKPAYKQVMKLFQKLCRDLGVHRLKVLLRLLRSFAWMDSAVEHHYHGQWRNIF
ncbi:hypothetical protein BJX63DRAFT_417109 [Aspergillus granulosus]|uniref:Uncharacterized protein n=1 Tax=Aspergillus granulosus TaxID=176169 RepID=A0ABR4GR66_9EURO